jgi:GNAT superfamily N-acetyltransferase
MDIGKIFDAISRFPCVIAKNDVNLIGFAFTSRFAPNILEVLNIFVSEDFRRKNIGTMILKKLEEQAFKITDAIILVNSILYRSNKKKRLADKFYLKNGYKEVFHMSGTKIWLKPITGHSILSAKISLQTGSQKGKSSISNKGRVF